MGFKRGGFSHLPYTSNAESELHELYQAGHNRGELSQMPLTDIKLPMHPIHGVVDGVSYPISELFIHRPDFYWRIGLVFIDQELDGPHHRNEPHYSRDRRINALLLKSGFIVKRYPFERMTKGLLKRIYVETCSIVNGYVEKWGR